MNIHNPLTLVAPCPVLLPVQVVKLVIATVAILF